MEIKEIAKITVQKREMRTMISLIKGLPGLYNQGCQEYLKNHGS